MRQPFPPPVPRLFPPLHRPVPIFSVYHPQNVESFSEICYNFVLQSTGCRRTANQTEADQGLFQN